MILAHILDAIKDIDGTEDSRNDIVCRKLSGGFNHKVWHILLAERAEFVLKQFHCDSSSSSAFEASFNASEKVAQFFEKNGLEAICAKELGDASFLYQHNGKYYAIYKYINASHVLFHQLNQFHLKDAGTIIAKMHNLSLKQTDGISKSYDLPSAQWLKESISSINKIIPYTQLPQITDSLLRWTQNALDHKDYALNSKNLIISHKDSHYMNIIWSIDGTCHVIDWEKAGYIAPEVEILGSCIEYSGFFESCFVKKNFECMANSYLSTIDGAKYPNLNSEKEIKRAFYLWIGGHSALQWIAENIKRALDPNISDSEAIRRKDIIRHMAKSFQFIQENEKDILRFISRFMLH